ncbi:MAG: anthranilate synthase component I family protein [Methanomicrobiaceae archaeon]|nr:anthranilate synthase component I family protein [Methanomicrobiaceae archaeon]
MDILNSTGEPQLNLGLEEFISAVEHQAKPLIIPLCAELPLPEGLSPLSVYAACQTGRGFLLESIEGSEKIARYSFIGLEPEGVVSIGDSVALEGTDAFMSIAEDPEGETPVDRIRSILRRFAFVNIKSPRFFGGMVGYFGYDCAYSLSGKLHTCRRREIEIPDARFMFVKDCIVFDHCEQKLFIFSSPLLTYGSDFGEEYHRSAVAIGARAAELQHLAKTAKEGGKRLPAPPTVPPCSSSLSKEAFEAAVEQVLAYIRAGEIFQGVISRRIECPLEADPFSVYAALREINPSPYMYYLDFGDSRIIGASPEMLLRVEKGTVTTVPIAGTRPRGATPQEDARLAAELLADEKERAEHTMLLDLARNDLGRVCTFGSVRVGDFMGVERFSHVQHIVSTVTGTLRGRSDCYDALQSCFPAGTVSGAPKLRAMQIIEEVESSRRGIYAGAVGYVGFDRTMEFAIAIRTIIAHENRAYIQVGAGIVADSVPEHEWYETESKGKAMVMALARAGARQ